MQNPNLLSDRKALLEASRKKLDESGYVYKKGKSRSKQFSSDDGESPVNKRGKINKEFRLSRMTELRDQIEDKNEQLKYKELRRDAAKNVHNYKECDKLTEQMSVLKADRRQLQLELSALTRKQKKAEWYLARKRTALKVTAPQPNSPPLHFASSSPEPRSPSSSFSAPRTPVSRRSSLNSSPSPVLQQACILLPPAHSSTSQVDGNNAFAPSPCESDGTLILSSDESSCDVSHQLPPLKRQRAFLVPNYGSPYNCTSISPSHSPSENTSTAVQHFQ